MKNLYIIIVIIFVSCTKETKVNIAGSWTLINTFDGTFNINWQDNRGMLINNKLCDCGIIEEKKAYNYKYDNNILCVENHIYQVNINNDTLILTENNFVSTFIKNRAKCF